MPILGVGNKSSVVDKAVKEGIDEEVSYAVIDPLRWSCIVQKGG
jgi:hypothetical protein